MRGTSLRTEQPTIEKGVDGLLLINRRNDMACFGKHFNLHLRPTLLQLSCQLFGPIQGRSIVPRTMEQQSGCFDSVSDLKH